jgi:predicted SnoaL-like aldol condensation-catalyzing enzyme
MKLRLALPCLILTSFVPVFAQEPVVGVADPESLFHSKDKKLDKNLQAAMHIMLDLLECNHWDDAPKYLTEQYLQHNPLAGSGRDNVMKFFKAMNRPQTPIPDKNNWKTKVVAVTATGDYVTVAIAREYPNPRDPGKTYTSTWFDMWRFVDGKADEHWDAQTLPAPNPNNKK